MNQQELRRAHVFVSGRVQGVWFRDATWRRASSLGVAGWVRNLADGRVEAVYEGRTAEVQEMIDWTWQGPDRAHVTHVAVDDEPPRGEQGFRVR